MNLERGPLFRLSFVLMILGLARVVFLSIFERGKHEFEKRMNHARKPGLPNALGYELTLIRNLWKKRPFRSFIVTVFHICLITVALFLPAHVFEWRRGVGFSWWSLFQQTADILSLIILITLVLMLIFRLSSGIRGFRFWKAGIFWLIILSLPCITGFLCVNGKISPGIYQAMMLLHVYTGNLILILILFSSLAACIIAPLSNVMTSFGFSLRRLFYPDFKRL